MATSTTAARVLARTSETRLLSAAARELADAGVPVFPCVPGGKRPLTGHGFLDATIDADQVEAWWRRHPEPNIGVPTGAASGVVVVDVDVHGPVSGYAAFDRAERAGLVAGWELLVATPSGGMHAYFPATPGVEQRSWQSAQVGVDFRGDGGYIVVPPSTIDVDGRGAGYRVQHFNNGPGATLDSGRLRDFLDPRPAPALTGTGPSQDFDFQRLAAWVADLQEGERNQGLFWAACRLVEHGTPPADAHAALAPAAEHAGLGTREVSATIRSAYRTTQPAPRSAGGDTSAARVRAPRNATGRVLS